MLKPHRVHATHSVQGTNVWHRLYSATARRASHTVQWQTTGAAHRSALQPAKAIDYNVPLTVRQAQEVLANSKRLMAQAVSWVGRNAPGAPKPLAAILRVSNGNLLCAIRASANANAY